MRAGLSQEAGVGGELFGEEGVVGDGGDDGYVGEVFGGGADHGGTADVDVFDDLVEGYVGFLRGLFEGVEVYYDHIDGLDVVGRDGGDVFGVVADVEDAAVDLGVEGLDAAVEHLGKAGEVGDIADGEAGVAEGFGGASGGDQLDVVGGEGLGEFDEAGFVGYGEEGSADGAEVEAYVRIGGHRNILVGF